MDSFIPPTKTATGKTSALPSGPAGSLLETASPTAVFQRRSTRKRKPVQRLGAPPPFKEGFDDDPKPARARKIRKQTRKRIAGKPAGKRQFVDIKTVTTKRLRAADGGSSQATCSSPPAKKYKSIAIIDRTQYQFLAQPSMTPETKKLFLDIGKEACSYRLGDLLVPAHFGESTVERDLKDQAILQKLQELLCMNQPATDEKLKLMNARILTEAARILRCVRCDGWCYHWLSIWLERPNAADRVLMVELVNHHESNKENHFFLLVPTNKHSNPCTAWEKSTTVSVMREQGLQGQFLDELNADNVVLVDPALNVITEITPVLFSQYLTLYAEKYDTSLSDSIDLRLLERFDKSAASLSEDDLTQVQQTTHQLLPIAAAQQEEFDFKRIKSKKGQNTVHVNKLVTWCNYMNLSPSVACPGLFRPGEKWTIGTLYCLFDSNPKAKNLLPDNRPNDLDILKCYRSSNEMYCPAVRRELVSMLEKGVSPDLCLECLGEKGTLTNYHLYPSHIPIPQKIYDTHKSKLKDEFDWQGLGTEAFAELSIETSQYTASFASLVDFLQYKHGEKVSSIDRMYDRVLKFFYHIPENNPLYDCRWQAIFLRDEIKEKYKKQPYRVSTHLLKHCMHEDKAQLTDHCKYLADCWGPLHTLHVCKADSRPYQRAMKIYLETCVRDRTPSKDIATQLTGSIHGSGEKLSIELPAVLTSDEITTWSGEAVDTLLRKMNISRELTPTGKTKIETLLKEKIASYAVFVDEETNQPTQNQMTLVDNLFRIKSFPQKMIELYSFFSASRIEEYKHSALRFLLNEFESPLAHSEPSKDHLFCLQDYDKIILLDPEGGNYKEELRAYVIKQLKQNRTLTAIAKRNFSKGMVSAGHFSITNPFRSAPTYDWSHGGILELMREEKESPEECLKRLFATYGLSNTRFRLECGIFMDKGHVSDFDGLVFDFIPPYAKRYKFEANLRKFQQFIATSGITPESRKWTEYVTKLKTRAESKARALKASTD